MEAFLLMSMGANIATAYFTFADYKASRINARLFKTISALCAIVFALQVTVLLL